MTYSTGNPVPSLDPRDLDDNAVVFDNLVNGSASSYPDRRGSSRKSWAQMEIDAGALVSPNVSALAGLTGAADRGFYFTGSGTMALYTLSSPGRALGGIANAAAGRTILAAAASGANTDITSITGSAASLTASRSISATGDATWSVNFNGAANATAAITLAASGVSAGTYGSVTVNAKGLVTAASAVTPVANGGTGQSTTAAHLTDLQTAGAYGKTNAVGTVSQTSGVPTGAIIETGTNANGEYTKYADGTMVCTRRFSVTSAINTAAGSIFYAQVSGPTFAVAFVGALPAVSYLLEDSVGLSWVSGGAATSLTTGPGVNLMAAISRASQSYVLNVTATGRWF